VLSCLPLLQPHCVNKKVKQKAKLCATLSSQSVKCRLTRLPVLHIFCPFRDVRGPKNSAKSWSCERAVRMIPCFVFIQTKRCCSPDDQRKHRKQENSKGKSQLSSNRVRLRPRCGSHSRMGLEAKAGWRASKGADPVAHTPGLGKSCLRGTHGGCHLTTMQ
jgi:hypothetical protein